MIFASDLDRTLIYSSRFLDGYPGDTAPVEEYEENIISHMSSRAMELLVSINERLIFVPTTTRSLEQYKRISVFQKAIKPKYAIVANGGMILINNEVDKAWQQYIAQRMSTIISPEQLILDNMDFFKREDIKLYKSCDGLFAYAVFHQRPEKMDFVDGLIVKCRQAGYTVTPNGRKLYFIPAFMTKWEAVKHIMELEQQTTLLAAGDSMLDEPIIANSSYGMIPLHGELSAHIGEGQLYADKILLTQNEGFESSNELLDHVVMLINQSA